MDDQNKQEPRKKIVLKRIKCSIQLKRLNSNETDLEIKKVASTKVNQNKNTLQYNSFKKYIKSDDKIKTKVDSNSYKSDKSSKSDKSTKNIFVIDNNKTNYYSNQNLNIYSNSVYLSTRNFNNYNNINLTTINNNCKDIEPNLQLYNNKHNLLKKPPIKKLVSMNKDSLNFYLTNTPVSKNNNDIIKSIKENKNFYQSVLKVDKTSPLAQNHKIFSSKSLARNKTITIDDLNQSNPVDQLYLKYYERKNLDNKLIKDSFEYLLNKTKYLLFDKFKEKS